MKQLNLLPFLALAACAATAGDTPVRYASEDGAKFYATAPATGEPQTCLPTYQVQSTRGVSDRAIIFETRGGDVYRNELSGRCPGARRDNAFSYTTPSSQLCRAEILTFFESSSPDIQYGSCALGEFVPIGDRAALREAEDQWVDEDAG